MRAKSQRISTPTPETQPASHLDVIKAIRSCCFATSKVMNYERKQDHDHEVKCYRALFLLLFKRRATQEELDYITGGSAGHCPRCNRELIPKENGTLDTTCNCEAKEKA